MMDTQLESIQIPSTISEYSFYYASQEGKELPKSQINSLNGCSKVNIFVGPNNSGKSRFLRELFHHFLHTVQIAIWKKVTTEYDKLLTDLKIIESEQLLNKFGSAKINLGELQEFQDNGLIFSWTNKLSAKPILNEIQNLTNRYYNMTRSDLIHCEEKEQNGLFFNALTNKGNKVVNEIKEVIEAYFSKIYTLLSNVETIIYRTYIPILRGLRPIGDQEPYNKRTINDYFSKNQVDIPNEIQTVFSGEGLYKKIKEHLLDTQEKRQKVREFEDFLSEYFFEGESISLIPKYDSDVLWVQIKKSERPIFELGDGIQSIIILTWPLFERLNDNLIIFIEEPELNLHPGYQSKFIRLIYTYEGFKNFQFFISTHSNHLIGSLISRKSVSIFSFQKTVGVDESFMIENLTENSLPVLEKLGVDNSSVFLSNCTIWVEGISDRKILGHLLNLFLISEGHRSSFEENLHYSFVEYSGSNLAHWDFSEGQIGELYKMKTSALSQHILLISDRDNQNGDKENIPNSKKERNRTFKEILAENFIVLRAKEIENIISPQSLKLLVKSIENNPEIEPKLDFSFQDYRYKPLGTFIKEFFPKSKKKYEDGNTIHDKNRFADKFIESTASINDFSPEAKRLTKKIFDFIKSKNQSIVPEN